MRRAWASHHPPSYLEEIEDANTRLRFEGSISQTEFGSTLLRRGNNKVGHLVLEHKAAAALLTRMHSKSWPKAANRNDSGLWDFIINTRDCVSPILNVTFEVQWADVCGFSGGGGGAGSRVRAQGSWNLVTEGPSRCCRPGCRLTHQSPLGFCDWMHLGVKGFQISKTFSLTARLDGLRNM